MIASGSPDCRAQTASARRFELRRSYTAEHGSRIPSLPGRSVRERLSDILTTSEFSNIGANRIRDRTAQAVAQKRKRTLRKASCKAAAHNCSPWLTSRICRARATHQGARPTARCGVSQEDRTRC